MRRWVREKRAEWNATAGHRIREVNPYNSDDYTRYYVDEERDPHGRLISGGDLVVMEVKGDYDLLQLRSRRVEPVVQAGPLGC